MQLVLINELDNISFINYINEYYDSNSNFIPLNLTKDFNYNDFYKQVKLNHELGNINNNNLLESLYLLKDNDTLIGHVLIIHDLDNTYVDSHIKYAIRPSMRSKGYGTKILELAFNKCSEIGIKNILITCHMDNTNSKNAIFNNNGTIINNKDNINTYLIKGSD